LWKHVKSQADNGNICDSLYYGSFAKAVTVSGDSAKKNYVYCPGPKAILKLHENEENLADISQQLLDDKLVNVNFGSVAEACNSTVETVQSILAGIRDEIVDHVINRRKDAVLSFGIGQLFLRQNGTVEFRSSTMANAVPLTDDINHISNDYGDRASNSGMSRA